MNQLRVDMSEKVNDRVRKVKSILVTQEAPNDPNSPYLKLAEKFNLKIDFRPFIEVQPVPIKEFRKQKIAGLENGRRGSRNRFRYPLIPP